MASQRYDLRKELDGTWTVFDVFTGLAYRDGPLIFAKGLPIGEANDLVDLLNGLDRKRRAARGDFD